MASLSSASTNSQVFAAYDDNASYEEDGSAAKARAFITACVILRRRLPQIVQQTGGSMITVQSLESEMERARAWIATNPDATSGTGGGVIHSSFEEFR